MVPRGSLQQSEAEYQLCSRPLLVRDLRHFQNGVKPKDSRVWSLDLVWTPVRLVQQRKVPKLWNRENNEVWTVLNNKVFLLVFLHCQLGCSRWLLGYLQSTYGQRTALVSLERRAVGSDLILHQPMRTSLRPALLPWSVTSSYCPAVCSLALSHTLKQGSRSLQSASSSNSAEPRSAYLHLPFCKRKCSYCDFAVLALGSVPQEANLQRFSSYTQLLLQEIKHTAGRHPAGLETVFFGGGTPSLLPPHLLAQLLTGLRSEYGLVPDAEISMEADPGTFTSESLAAYMDSGVNRFSVGVQVQSELS